MIELAYNKNQVSNTAPAGEYTKVQAETQSEVGIAEQ